VARLLADENVPLPVVEALRSHGHDVVALTASSLGSGASDASILALARAEQRVVVTLDRRDFFRLHRQTPEHGGIVACTFDPDFAGQAKRIHEALSPERDLRGLVLRVHRPPG
jgi:predicted nuclease of predicted toxin-antitoxin system